MTKLEGIGKFFTVEEVAEILGVSRPRCYDMIREGLLPCIRLGYRNQRVEELTLLNWIKAGGVPEDEEKSGFKQGVRQIRNIVEGG